MTTDKQLVKKRFGNSFRRYDRLAVVQQAIGSRLAGMISSVRPPVEVRRALEIGAGTGFLTGHLVPMFPGARWTLNDIAEASEPFIRKYMTGADAEFICADAESMELGSGYDLIASSSTVQWFDDLSGFIRKAYQSTAGQGLLALSTFGKENFCEIKAASGEGLEYHSQQELTGMLTAAGYRLEQLHEYTESLVFCTPVDVLHHIKATGVNSLKKAQWSKGKLAEFSRLYYDNFSDRTGKGVTLTYHPILIVAKKI